MVCTANIIIADVFIHISSIRATSCATIELYSLVTEAQRAKKMVHWDKRAAVIDFKFLMVKVVVKLAPIRSETVVARGWRDLLEKLGEEVVDRVLRDKEGWEQAPRKIQSDFNRVHRHAAPRSWVVGLVV